MISSIKRQGLYEVSIGIGKDSYAYENDWLNFSDRAFGTICLAFSPSLHYLIDFAEYPKYIWTKLDRTFGKHNEDIYRNLGRKFKTTRVLYSKLSASTLSDEFFQDEEEAQSSS